MPGHFRLATRPMEQWGKGLLYLAMPRCWGQGTGSVVVKTVTDSTGVVAFIKGPPPHYEWRGTGAFSQCNRCEQIHVESRGDTFS